MTFAAVQPLATMQRVRGTGRLAVRERDGKTCLDRLFQEGAAKIRLPRQHGLPQMEAVLINTAGGMTGGDTLDWTVEAGPGCAITLTTQACEKAYRSTGEKARVTARVTAGAGARVNWLPQETILYQACALERRLEIDLEAGARLLLSEAVVLGRHAMGEVLDDARLTDRWRIRVGGKLVHAEETRLDATVLGQKDATGLLNGAGALATVVMIAPESGDLRDRLRACLAGIDGLTAGVSHVEIGQTGKLVARLLAQDGMTLRRGLVPALELLNPQAGLPKVWRL